MTNAVQIAGVTGGAFEAIFNYRIHAGHDEVTGFFTAGDGVGGHGQFQVIVDVSGAAFQLDRVFVEVFHISPKDGAELDKVIVPAILGSKIVPGYLNYVEHVVQPGDNCGPSRTSTTGRAISTTAWFLPTRTPSRTPT